MEDELELDEEVCKGVVKMGRRAHQDFFPEENHLSQTNSPAAQRPSSKPHIREGVWSGFVGVNVSKSKKKPAEQEVEDHRLRQQSIEADNGEGFAPPINFSSDSSTKESSNWSPCLNYENLILSDCDQSQWLSAITASCAMKGLLRSFWI